MAAIGLPDAPLSIGIAGIYPPQWRLAVEARGHFPILERLRRDSIQRSFLGVRCQGIICRYDAGWSRTIQKRLPHKPPPREATVARPADSQN